MRLPIDQTVADQGAGERNDWGAEAAFLLLILMTLPARIPLMKLSVWLDEAWVANSILAPTVSDTLNYSNWVQSSPPLYLMLGRLAAWTGGPGEVSLRMPSLIASVCALALTGRLLRSAYGFVPAWIGIAILAANYTQLKYGQQVKQYATDMLTAALLTWLLARALKAGGRWSWTMVAAAGVAPFLSFPAVFFLPSIVIVAALESGGANWPRRLRAAVAASAGPAILLAINYVVFIYPNRTPALLRNWRRMFVDISSPVQAMEGVIRTIGDLLVPEALPGGGPLGAAMVLFLLGAGIVALRDAPGHAPRAQLAVAAGVAPLGAGFAAACLGLYPMLWNTRMLIWALPSCGLLIAFAVGRLMKPLSKVRWLAPASVAGAAVVVAASQFVLLQNPREGEKNREAVATLQHGMAAGDCLYLQGGLSEQFGYYERLAGWKPPCVYLGNTGWPCCGRNVESRVGDYRLKDVRLELQKVTKQAAGHRLWLLLPAGSEGHWSRMVERVLRQVPAGLEQARCVERQALPFGQTRLIVCRPLP